MIKPHELRPMSEKELLQRIKDNTEAIDKIRFQKAVGGEVKNPVQVRYIRKEIARMKTILRERQHAGSAQTVSAPPEGTDVKTTNDEVR